MKPPSRPTVGFLVDALFDGFQEGIWNSIADAAQSLDVNLLCFLGGSLWHKQVGGTVYTLISEENVDGLIVLSGSLGSLIGEEQLASHYEHLPSIPIVSISRPIEGLPSVLVDNETGMRELMVHLVEFHGRKRIAFIRGPETNPEAETRFQIYRESLERYGIQYEPARVFVGEFDRNSGIRAVQAFVDERKVDFDAVVGANDCMAIQAMKELQRRGRRIPDDILVAGFDDIKDSTSTIPLLTTVRQPLYDIGREAIRKTLALIRGESVPERTVFPTTLVVRRSCGCIRPSDSEPSRAKPGLSQRKADGPINRTYLADLLEPFLPGEQGRFGPSSSAKELADALYDELDGIANGRFISLLESLIARGFARRLGSSHWHQMLGAAFKAIRRDVDTTLRERLEDLWETSLLMVGSMVEQAQFALRLQSEEEFRILPRVFVINHLDEAEIKQVILDEFPALGIRSFYLSHYTDETREHASLFAHFSFSTHVTLEPSLSIFPSRRLVPGDFSRAQRYSYAVLPIQSRSEPIGFALCEMGPLSGAAYEALITQISAALKASSLIREVRQHANDLEVRVDERTRQLKEAQEQLVETAHEAGMAEIAIGVLHNLGNLLNTVNISAEEIKTIARSSRIEGLAKVNELLQDHADDLASFFAQDPKARLLPNYLSKITESLKGDRSHIQGEIGELLSQISLIRETINALQEYARGGKDTFLRETIAIQAVVEAVLKIHEALLASHHVLLRMDFADVPPIVTQRAKAVHVLVNVIKNAVEAMQNTPEDRRFLTIAVRPEAGGAVSVRISDTGDGISPENLKKIFSYGFTTRRSGHGFGLHACANYMSQMNGSISVESPGAGQGATFTMVFGSSS